MRKAVLFIAAAGMASACTPRPATPTPPLSGRQLAEHRCASCHAIGEADASANPAAPTFRSLYRRYPVDGLREAFTKGMEVGHRDMPRFVLAPDEIDRLVDYLRSLNPCTRPSSDAAAMKQCFAPMAP